MTAINFDKEINTENVIWLIEQINLSKSPIIIYVCSDGGNPSTIQPAIDFINKLVGKKDITLIAFSSISSAAFDLFWQTKCKKDVLPGTFALIHKTKLEMDESNKTHLEQKKVAKEQDADLYQFLKRSKALPLQELRNFNNNKDVIVGYDRLCKLLNIKK